ncbi:MAG: hypothetical protein K0R90_570 [Oscillospiraceae bacterium]|jgi:hypothetical protein|nr:hypothetical protein [Oscillospiraceae bacterium]
MGNFKQLKQEFVENLIASNKLGDVLVLEEYPAKQSVTKITKPIVSIGISDVSIQNGAFIDYLGLSSGQMDANEIYGKNAQVTFCFKIYAPIESGGNVCHEIFSRLCDYMVFDSELDFEQITAEKQGFDKSVSGYVLIGKAVTCHVITK